VADRWRCMSQTGFGAQPNISANLNERMCDVMSELQQGMIQSDAFWKNHTNVIPFITLYLPGSPL